MIVQSLSNEEYPDLTNIKLPLVLKDKILMSPGIWNNYYYDLETIQKAFENTDWENKQTRALLWDHKDNEASNWIGEVKNPHIDGRNVRGDLVIVNEDAARALLYGAKFGISPKVVGEEENQVMKDYVFANFSTVIDPAVKTAFINNSTFDLKKLTPEERKALPDSAFALPKERKYPIHDKSHGKNALSRVSAHGTPEEKEKVREAVYKKYPSLKKEKNNFDYDVVGDIGFELDENYSYFINADGKICRIRKVIEMTEKEKVKEEELEELEEESEDVEEEESEEPEEEDEEAELEEEPEEDEEELSEDDKILKAAEKILEERKKVDMSESVKKLGDAIKSLNERLDLIEKSVKELANEPEPKKEFNMSQIHAKSLPSDISDGDREMMTFLRGQLG